MVQMQNGIVQDAIPQQNAQQSSGMLELVLKFSWICASVQQFSGFNLEEKIIYLNQSA